ncbi:hypothetical protein ACQ7B2_16355, partial [Escherichia coli]
MTIVLDERLEKQSAGFAMKAENMPAWIIMDQIAKSVVVDGRWEREGKGYRLVGAPKYFPPPPVPRAAGGTTD